jgi:hypothetical protein
MKKLLLGFAIIILTVSAKSQEISYTLKNFRLVLISNNKIVKTYPLPVLNPGESTQIKMTRPSATTTIAVENAGGFKVYDSGIYE